MSLEPRQRVLLWILGGLVVIVGWNQLDRLWSRGGSSLGVATPRAGDRQRSVTTDVVGLDVALLEAPTGEFELGRDPFRYGVEPRPAPTPVVRQERPRQPVVQPPPPEPAGPVPPSVDHFKYLGSFGREGNRIAVLISGDEIYNLREGEAFDSSFSIDEIGYESVAIGFVDFPEAIPKRLPVGG